VAQPAINLDETHGIISVELAGATDPDRVRKYLQSTANLQFWKYTTLANCHSRSKMPTRLFKNYLNGVKADTVSNVSPASLIPPASKKTPYAGSKCEPAAPQYAISPAYPGSKDGKAPFLPQLARRPHPGHRSDQ